MKALIRSRAGVHCLPTFMSYEKDARLIWLKRRKMLLELNPGTFINILIPIHLCISQEKVIVERRVWLAQ